MKYLIPAWYHEGAWWRDKVMPFYETHHITEFDDMVSLGNMFHKHQEAFEIICLNHHSELRNFLYRNGLFESRYWSVFDEIQGFEAATPEPVDYRDLHWPEGTEFIYTPYIVKGYTGEATASNIYMSQEGYLTWIEDKLNHRTIKRYVFDDRGFLSSLVHFNEMEQPVSIEYLDQSGAVVMTETLQTGHVSISDASIQRFEQVSYDSMIEVIQEYLIKHLKEEQHASYIVASDPRHNTLLAEVIAPEQLTYSLFRKRQSDLSHNAMAQILSAAHVLADSEEQVDQLRRYQNQGDVQAEIMHHTPFPATVLPNLSSQLQETEIGLVIDGLSLARIHDILDVLIPYVEKGDDLRLVLLTRYSRSEREQELKARIDAVNEAYATAQPGYMLMDEDEIAALKLIRFAFIPFESDVMKQIATLRIMIDLNQEPDLFIQISSISAGIPQLNCTKTPYMEDKANGLLISDISELPQALNTFLIGLKQWNFAFAYSIQLIEAYASKQLVQQINRLIEGETYGT